MKSIAFINLKGGTAKTTSAVSVAYCLAERGERVLLVDLDPQGSSSDWLRISDRNATALLKAGLGQDASWLELTEIAEPWESIRVLGADRSLSAVEDLRASALARRLESLLEEAEGAGVDYCLIDPPPSASSLTLAALLTATSIISPVAPSRGGLDGLTHTMQLSRQVGGATLQGAFACRVDMRTNSDQQVVPLLRENLGPLNEGGKAFETFIRETVRVREAETDRTPPPSYDPRMTAALDYQDLSTEIESL